METGGGMKEKPIKKAFACWPPKGWFDFKENVKGETFYAETASKARYQAKLQWDIANPYWIDIRVRRSPENDLFEPKPVEILSELTEEQRGIIGHSNGNYSKEPGFRDYYHCQSDDPDLLKLVSLKLMSGPQKNSLLFDEAAFFFLTESGKEAAFSMLPRKRGEAA